MKIYTKTGDNGTTRLVDGSCVEKFNPRVEAYGTVDELNSFLGLIKNELQSLQMHNQIESLTYIQHCLFRAGSLLATEKKDVFDHLPALTDVHIHFLEHQMDEMSEDLPALKSFILPDGHPACCKAHYARTLCRRAERRCAEISLKDDRLKPTLIFLNRLSDYLFVLARYINIKTNHPEVHWNKNHDQL